LPLDWAPGHKDRAALAAGWTVANRPQGNIFSIFSQSFCRDR